VASVEHDRAGRADHPMAALQEGSVASDHPEDMSQETRCGHAAGQSPGDRTRRACSIRCGTCSAAPVTDIPSPQSQD